MGAVSILIQRHRRIGDVTPKEFSKALWEHRRVLVGTQSATGLQTLQLGIMLTHFIRLDPPAAEFERQLENMIADHRPRRKLMQECAKEALRAWRARRWDRLDDGTLVILDPPMWHRRSK